MNPGQIVDLTTPTKACDFVITVNSSPASFAEMSQAPAKLLVDLTGTSSTLSTEEAEEEEEGDLYQDGMVDEAGTFEYMAGVGWIGITPPAHNLAGVVPLPANNAAAGVIPQPLHVDHTQNVQPPPTVVQPHCPNCGQRIYVSVARTIKNFGRSFMSCKECKNYFRWV